MKILPNSIDIQRCTKLVENKFDLIIIASIRAREIKAGNKITTGLQHKPTVLALQEIQSGKIGRELLRRVGQRRSR